MKHIYIRALPYLRHLNTHPALPVPANIREDLCAIVNRMDGLPENTVVSDWVEKQLRSGVQ